MMVSSTPHWAGASGVVSRGVLTGGATGMTIGGVVGTADWPVVGTFFAAVAGVIAGVITGVFVGVTLTLTTRRVSRPLTQRIVGTAGAATVIAVGHLVRVWPAIAETMSSALLAAVLVVVVGLASPIIASGMPDARFRGRQLPDALAWMVVLGAGTGVTVGALVGIIIGLNYLPLVWAAAIEGGVLGSVSGCVLSLLVCAGVVVKSSLGRTRNIR